MQLSILNEPLVVEDGIGFITFKGSMVSSKERRELRKAAGFHDSQVKRKAKVATKKKPPLKSQEDETSESEIGTCSDSDSDLESLNSNDSEGIIFCMYLYLFVLSLTFLISLFRI